MVDIKLIQLCTPNLIRALQEVLNDREYTLKRYLKNVQGIDVDREVWTQGLHGILYAFEKMTVDEKVKELTDPDKIFEDIKARMEVRLNASVQG